MVIAKGKGGGIVWLETGDERAGLIHILQGHINDFKNRGIRDNEIPAFILNMIKNETPIEIIPDKKGYTLLLQIDNKRYKMATGSNGYVVTAYPSKRK